LRSRSERRSRSGTGSRAGDGTAGSGTPRECEPTLTTRGYRAEPHPRVDGPGRDTEAVATPTPPPDAPLDTIVFDLGGVLVDWDPRHLYRRLLGSSEAAEELLRAVDLATWNHAVDLGAPLRPTLEEVARRHPAYAEEIRAFGTRWLETVAGPIPGMEQLVSDCRAHGLRLYLLTNSSAETYPLVAARYPFVGSLDGAVVSGAERVAKPDPEIYARVVRRFRLRPASCLVVDDRPENVAAAEAAGFRAHRFSDARTLRRTLEDLGVPGMAD
jgi:2-haloacid dehalogenase